MSASILVNENGLTWDCQKSAHQNLKIFESVEGEAWEMQYWTTQKQRILDIYAGDDIV